MILPCRLEQGTVPADIWGSVGPSERPELPQDVIVGRTLIDLRQPNLAVRTINLSTEEKTIKKGVSVATFEPVECVTTQEEHVVSEEKNNSAVPEHLHNLFEQSKLGLDAEQKEKLCMLLAEFGDVFSKGTHDLGKTSLTTHKIDTGTGKPIKLQPRRLPIAKKEEADQMVQDMYNQGVVEPSGSPWSTPVVLVKKKYGTSRFCVDYRKLNDITKKDSYPLPCVDTTLDAFSGSNWFSTLDMKCGYWQVDMQKEDREKTAFSPGRGLWQFTVMPFGLCNAPATFERLMELVLAGLPWNVCLVYFDDILVHAKTFDEEVTHLREVFVRLRKANLKLNLKKCELFRSEVQYLGHVVTRQGIATDCRKVEAVRSWPVPKSKKELRSFLGLCTYYRRFVQSFAEVVRPLNRLTQKETSFSWSAECNEAFLKLKELMTTAPVLAYPTSTGIFT
jgi:hypothetical protein